MSCTKESGRCFKCQGACENKPGWFAFGEVEKVAAHLGVSTEELFKTKLAVDWWEGDGFDGGNIYLLSPALVNEDSGTEFPGDPSGACVFFQKGKCSIHEVKPFECRESIPCTTGGPNLHKMAADSWNTQDGQQQIVQLLGREPEATEYSGGGLFGFMKMFA